MSYHKTGFLLIALLLAALLAAACTNSPESAQKKIDKMASDMQQELPKMLDRDTRLINVYTKKMELVSEYELVNYKADGQNTGQLADKIELYLKTQVCPGIKKELLSKGISSRYIYKDNSGQVIGNWQIAPGDC